MNAINLAAMIESTLLDPLATASDVQRRCLEAVEFGVFGVCVAPCRVGLARKALAGTGLKVVSVAGFPLGFESRASKEAEISDLLESGADEVDVVANLGLIAEGEWHELGVEAKALRAASGSAILKVILETGRFSPAQVALAGRVWVDAGVDYLKTSTGFGPRGASVEDVHFLSKVGEGRTRVKAAGGIRTREDALRMVNAGAARLGTSSAGAILRSVVGG